MELITEDLLKKSKKYYTLKYYPIFHQAISLVISQKITFGLGRTIRKNFLNLLKMIHLQRIICKKYRSQILKILELTI